MPTPTPIVGEIKDRERRKVIIREAANQHREKYPLALLLAMASLESKGKFSNDETELERPGGVMGITTYASACYTMDGYKPDEVPTYTDIDGSLRQNMKHGACHLNGYAWDQANPDTGPKSINAVIQKEITNGSYRQMATAPQWYTGILRNRQDYLGILANIIEGKDVESDRSLPIQFPDLSIDLDLVQALREGRDGVRNYFK